MGIVHKYPPDFVENAEVLAQNPVLFDNFGSNRYSESASLQSSPGVTHRKEAHMVKNWKILLSALLVLCLIPLGSFATGTVDPVGVVENEWFDDEFLAVERSDEELAAISEDIIAELISQGRHPVYAIDANGNEQWWDAPCEDTCTHGFADADEQADAGAELSDEELMAVLAVAEIHGKGAYLGTIYYHLQCNTPVAGFCTFAEYDYYRCTHHPDKSCYIEEYRRTFTAPHNMSAWAPSPE